MAVPLEIAAGFAAWGFNLHIITLGIVAASSLQGSPSFGD
jgi:hypothetical protein